jgi:hypothetical protein
MLNIEDLEGITNLFQFLHPRSSSVAPTAIDAALRQACPSHPQLAFRSFGRRIMHIQREDGKGTHKSDNIVSIICILSCSCCVPTRQAQGLRLELPSGENVLRHWEATSFPL